MDAQKGLGRLLRSFARNEPAGTHEGRTTGISGGAITGWAWDPAHPYEPLEIEIYAGSRKIGHTRADVFDLELAKANLGNGMHRFEARLDQVPPGEPPFHLRLVIAGTDVELGPSVTLATVEDAEQLLAGCEYLGRVTAIENGLICGWVMNRRNPHERPVLTLRDGDKTVLTHLARDGTTVATDTGATANAYKFELPLPANLLDGALHHLSVTVGEGQRDIEGSPILFGPSDFVSLNRSLVSAFDRLQRLDRRVDALQSPNDRVSFERQLTTRILDRIDMLLNIHRDGIERELAVMRRQLTELRQLAPQTDAAVIFPLITTANVDEEIVPPPASFTLAGRSSPLRVVDLGSRNTAVTPKGSVRWATSQGAGISISGSGGMQFDDAISAPASMILSGSGAQNPFEFCGFLTALDGYPLSGRVDVFDNAAWSFTATTIGATLPGPTERGLGVKYLSGGNPPRNPLTLEKISVFGHGRLPPNGETMRPKARIIYLGSEETSQGWYAVEVTGRGGMCWMGARSETMFRLQPGQSYSFAIPEVRPVTAEIMHKMQISVGGMPAKFQIAPFRNDSSAFSVKGECAVSPGAEDDVVFEISFPKEFVRSPMELGINDDERPLTVAVHAIALGAI